jgi:hypothetical protein
VREQETGRTSVYTTRSTRVPNTRVVLGLLYCYRTKPAARHLSFDTGPLALNYRTCDFAIAFTVKTHGIIAISIIVRTSELHYNGPSTDTCKYGTEPRCRGRPFATIADKQGWTPAADDTAEALGLNGHTLGRIPEDGVGEEDVPKDLDLDVTRAVVTSRVTSDAYARPSSLRTRACLRDYEAAHINSKRSWPPTSSQGRVRTPDMRYGW